MKIVVSELKRILKESIDGNKILSKRPWSVEYAFTLSGGNAEDSEGKGPDGFAVTMAGDSGKTVKVIVDSYWNPQAGDSSGNSLKVEADGNVVSDTYVPTRFDDGEEQTLIISNSPVPGLLTVSHSADSSSPPIVYLAIPNPFDEGDDVSFDAEKIGNGNAKINLKGHSNL